MAAGSLRQPGFLVYACGVATSLMTMVLVELLNRNGENIMGWYANGIIPAGALIVGVGSGLGYALAGRMLQTKLQTAFIVAMVLTAVVDYTAKQYLTYANEIEQAGIDPEDLSFVDYFRATCENMQFAGRHGGQPGNPLGVWGYGFKLLEIVGYVVGAVAPSLVVGGLPYCKACQQYLVKHRTAHLNSPHEWKPIKKLAKNDRAAKMEETLGPLVQQAHVLGDEMATASLADTLAVLDRLDAKAASNAVGRVEFTLNKCPRCDAHRIVATLSTYGIDKQAATNALFTLEKMEPATSAAAESEEAA